MAKVYRSLAYAAADSYFSLALQLVSTVVLARILSPQEIGTFAIAAVFTALASNFRNFGITEYLIQKRELLPETIRAAFAVNICVSWAMGLLILGISPLVSRFYDSAAIAQVMVVQSLSFFMIPFGAITLAYFRRELMMRPIFIANVTGNAVALVVAIVLAMHDFGYMSLAWSGFAGVVANVGTSLWFRPSWLPRWPSFKGARAALHFGKHISGVYLFSQLGNGAPEMIIGRTEGLEPVAYFSRASGFVELFNRLVLNAICPIVLPIFSEKERVAGGLRDAFLVGVSYLTAVAWPIIFFMGFMAFPAIRIVYGVQWIESTYLAQVLCITAAISILYHLTSEALIAKGQVKETNYLQIKVQGIRIIGLLAVIPFGLSGAVWGSVVAGVGGALLCHRALRVSIGLTWVHMLTAVTPSLGVALASVLPVAVLTLLWTPGEQNFIRVGLAGSLLTAVAWCLAMRRTGHPLWLELVRVIQPQLLRIRSLSDRLRKPS